VWRDEERGLQVAWDRDVVYDMLGIGWTRARKPVGLLDHRGHFDLVAAYVFEWDMILTL
jgi:hypothetical protein